MDRAKAEALSIRLVGRELDGWRVEKFVNNGKSAAVFEARQGEDRAAIKIYDEELVAKYGDLTQLERLNREKSLKNHGHPNLVAIYESGYDDSTSSHYLTMEFLPNRDLAQTLGEVPFENIPRLIEQLASAAEFLEEKGYAHRDIKPANIVVVDDWSRLILLDFGVLKPVGEAGLTDAGGTLFVGTNQYASPEFAMRKEEDTLEAWRAVTFYQIGAVIHDLVMRKPIFAEATSVPARLAYAVQSQVPVVESTRVAPSLIKLARYCLVKSPQARLRLVTWTSFKAIAPSGDHFSDLKERVRARIAASAVREQELAAFGEIRPSFLAFQHRAEELVKEALQEAGGAELGLPRRVVYKTKGPLEYIIATFEPSVEHAIPSGLTIGLRVHVVDEASGIVSIAASSEAAATGSEWNPELKEEVYLGTADAESVREAVLKYVLERIEDAQMSDSASSGL